MKSRLVAGVVLGLGALTSATTYLTGVGHAADPNATPIAQGVQSFTTALAGLEGLEELADPVAFSGLLPTGDDGLRLADVFAQSLGDGLTSRLAGSGFDDTAALEQFLDDPDGNGDPDDDGTYAGVAVDVGGAITQVSGVYDLVLSLELARDGTTPLQLPLPAFDASGGALAQDLDLTASLAFRYDPGQPAGTQFALLTSTAPTLTTSLDLDLTPAPYTVDLGLTTAAVSGTADIGTDVVATVVDPTPDGRITQDDWTSTAALDLFELAVTSSHADLSLSLDSGIPGVPTGTVSLSDDDLTNGVAAPTVALGQLADFQSMTPLDFLGGLAHVAGALDALQQSGPADLDLPLMSDRLSELVVVNERLKAFFVDNGLSAPETPLTLGPGPGVTAEAYAELLADFDTLQEMAQPIADALGIGLLAFAYDPTRRRLEWDLARQETRAPVTAELDLGSHLQRLGVVGVEDAASQVSLTPTVELDLGVSVDLTPPVPPDPDAPEPTVPTVLDRFAVETAGTELAVDAPITGDLDLVGKIGFVGLDLADSDTGGPVELLARADDARPMLTVDLDGGADDLLTLAELFEASADPASAPGITVDVNAEVPEFGLTASATVGGGAPLASGTLTVAWPDVTVGTPTVTGEADFDEELLSFDFDHGDPLALFAQVTTAVRTFADALDGLSDQAAGDVLSRDLPFAGTSFDDLANRLGEVRTTVDELLADPPATLQVLESRLETALGDALEIPPDARSGILSITRPDAASGPSTLVFDLSYGLCSEATAGCLKETGPLDVPFTFDLGADTGGIVGTSADGEVSLDYAALASLDFGVELPAVTAGATADALPTAAGAPRAFVLDTSTASLTAELVAGGTLQAHVGPLELSLGKEGDEVDAKVAAAITLDNDAAAAGPTRLSLPSPEFEAWLSGLVPTDIGPADADRVSCDGGTTLSDACARIPVYADPDDPALGVITLTWADLTELSPADPDGPQLAGAEAVFDALIARGLDFGLVLDGMQRVLVLVTEALEGASYGTALPVVGDSLDAGADVARLLDENVVQPLQTLEGELSGSSDPTLVETRLQQFFLDALALPGGGSLLQDRNGDGVDAADVVVNALCDDGDAAGTVDAVDGPTDCTSSHSVLHLYDVELGFALGQSGAAGTPVDFDLGLPGLRFEMSDDPSTPADDLTASASWALDLAFGLSVDHGFYLRTDNPFGQPGPGGQELSLAASLELPHTPLTGDIAFLPFSLEDRTTAASDPKDLELSLGVDLKSGSADRLALTDLVGGVDPADDAAVDVVLGGGVNFDVHFETGPFGTEDSSVPTFVADFLLTWGFTAGTLGGEVGDLNVEFNDVGIDLGSLLSSFLEPVLGEAGRLTKPLKPVVDIVTAPIPGLTDAAAAFGCPATLPFPEIIAGVDLCTLSLLDVYEKTSGADLTLVRQLIGLIQFINAVTGPEAGGETVLPLGSFDLLEGVALAGPVTATQKDALFDAGSVDPHGSATELPKPLESFASATVEAAVADATKTGTEKGGFTFPAFEDPTRLFTMLLGKDVTLVHWDAGSLEASVTIPLEIGPPIGPLPVSLGITIAFGVRGHFAVGYDTKGIRQAFERLTNDDPADDGALATVGTLFAGIGVDDRLRVNGEPTGEDIPEITLYGSLTAKAALDLLIVEAGVRGGVAAELNANLHDGGFGEDHHTDPADQFSHHPENLDGVLRLDELASFLGNPVCLFDYDGRITAFLEAYVDYTLGEESFTIVGPVTLYDFSEVLQQACATEPVLAHVDGDGNLVLHAGAFADLREFQEDVEVERFVVRQLDVAGTRFSVAAFGFEQEFDSVSGKVFGDGGSGNDSIVLEPGADLALGAEPPATGEPGNTVLSTVIPFTRLATLCGGAGNDVLSSGSAGDTLVGDGVANTGALACSTAEAGDDGADDITGGGGADGISAGGGPDKVKGGDGGDTIDAGTGDDVVLGGGVGDADEADTIRSGPDSTTLSDADTVFGSTGDDVVDGGAGPDTLEGDVGEDVLRGGPGDDTLRGRADDDLLEGQGDHDTLLGGDGDDDLRGGDGDDDADGEAGDDLLSGGADDDDLVGGRDSTGTSGASDPGDVLHGDAGLDHLVGDEGTVVRPAGVDVGTTACTGSFAGDDTLSGGSDGDVLHGCAGVDLMHGDEGDDVMVGAAGDDDMFGDGGADAMSGDGGADDMEGGSGDDPMRGGDGPDRMLGNDGLDTMFGDSGDDVMLGGADADTVRGGLGDDSLEGNGGADTVNGDDGADLVVGGSAAAGQPDAGDTLWGSTGPDHLIGDNGVPGLLHDLDSTDASLGGRDVIDGGADDDQAYGGLADDEVRGGSGRDHLEGGPGADDVRGEDGADDVIGGSSQRLGGTTPYGDAGDRLSGGASDDVLLGDNGDVVTAAAGAGTPALRGRGMSVERTVTLYDLGHAPALDRSGDDVADGGDGPDALLGQGATDTLHGDGGDDLAAGGQGSDAVHGDAGQDDLLGGSYVVHSGDGQGRVGQLDAGDTVVGGAGHDVALGDNGLLLRGTLQTSPVTQGRGMTERLVELFDLGDAPVVGTSGRDALSGEAAADVLLGQGGRDRVQGGAGDDHMEGGPDVDWLEGGADDDDQVGGSSTVLGDDTGRTAVGQPDGADVVLGGAGDDLQLGDNAVVSRTSPSNPLTVRLAGAGDRVRERQLRLLDLTRGGPLDELATPPSTRFGSDHLSGGQGVDVQLGQDGDEQVFGGSEDDYQEGNGGTDTLHGDRVLSSAVPLAGLDVDLPGTRGGDEELEGVQGADGQDDQVGGSSRRTHRDERDVLHGDGAADFQLGDNGQLLRTVLSGDVYDVYRDYNATTVVRRSDRYDVGFGPTLPGPFGGDELHGGDGDDYQWGQDGDDTMHGDAQNDDMHGELGADQMFGHTGEDAMVGDRGVITDTLVKDGRRVSADTQGPAFFVYEGLRPGQLDRRIDLAADGDGDVNGTGSAVEQPGLTHGGGDTMRGGPDHDVLHGAFGDDLMNGDSGGDWLFGAAGVDVLWGGQGKPVSPIDPTANQRTESGSTYFDSYVDYLFGGASGAESTDNRYGVTAGADVLDWRPRGTYASCAAVTRVTASCDPGDWFLATETHDDDVANNQHHSGIDWIYGGEGRDVLQGDVGKNGPDDGDRLMDWNGAFNLYTRCNASYGDDGDIRQHSPAVDRFLHTLAFGSGAGPTEADLRGTGRSGERELAFVQNGEKGNAGKAFPGTPGHFNQAACAP